MSKLTNIRIVTALVLIVPVLFILVWYLLISPNYSDDRNASSLLISGESLNYEIDSDGIEILSSKPEKVRVEGEVTQYLIDGTYIMNNASDGVNYLVFGDTNEHTVKDIINLSGVVNYITPANVTESSGLAYVQLLADGVNVNKFIHTSTNN